MNTSRQIEATKMLLQQIEKVVKDDYKAEINGRTYQLSKMTYKQALPFLEYYESIQPNPITGIAVKKMVYSEVEDMLSNYVLFDGALIKNLPTHFDKYRRDYKAYINTMLMVAIYDFLQDELQLLKEL